ncbi:MAG: hypothetical protein M3O70_19590 [Actinomycetota bacterium]|nr:hypothetical protein [Actinomycetota bacterium]
MADDSYKVSVEGGGIQVDREVSQDVALGIINYIMGGELPAGVSGDAGGDDDGAGTGAVKRDQRRDTGDRPGLSVGEFLSAHEANRNVDKIVAMAAYLDRHRGHETVTDEQLKQQFQAARQTAPANWSRDLGLAVQGGWIAEVPGEKDTYYVTETGFEVVDKNFPRDMRGKTRQTSKAKTRNKSDAKAAKKTTKKS